jgi:hypothetical protein
VLNVMCDIMEASPEFIPMSAKVRPEGKSKRENLPGWNENVAPAKEDALFWNAFGLSSGWSSSGRWSRNQFHYTVRRA